MQAWEKLNSKDWTKLSIWVENNERIWTKQHEVQKSNIQNYTDVI